ncbi:sulfite exporter TauE/SafE family protein [Flaviaesturariibacter terrae]
MNPTSNTEPEVLVETEPVEIVAPANNGERRWKRLASRLVLFFALLVVANLVVAYLPLPPLREWWSDLAPTFNRQFFLFVLAGFVAQMVDGVLSMGYGVTSATFLMSLGISPVSVSAAIHTSEVFTTGISGYSHYKFGNVNKKLFRHLVIPGVLGAVLGAGMLVLLGERAGKWLMPAIALYAGFLGLKILIKAFGKPVASGKVKRLGLLAAVGGFLDSFGGGGWGPIVTSSLIAKGRSPKYTVGSVSLTEFFVTLASAFTFLVTVGVSHLSIVLGLLTGGCLAAPVAARLAGRLPRKTMMIAVGVMVMIWCVRMFLKSIQ